MISSRTSILVPEDYYKNIREEETRKSRDTTK